jgi:hypothetical protein
MVASVYFNHQLCRRAKEINDIVTDNLLSIELIAFYLFHPYFIPNGHFGIGHLSSECFGEPF